MAMYSYDNVIDALFQALPANSFKEMLGGMNVLGFNMTDGSLRTAIRYLRKNCNRYGWTIPHVGNPPIYFALLCEKDGEYSHDHLYKASLMDGSKSMTRRIVTQTANQAASLRAASQATHLSRANREKLIDLAEDYEYLTRKTMKVLRQVHEAQESDGTNGEAP